MVLGILWNVYTLFCLNDRHFMECLCFMLFNDRGRKLEKILANFNYLRSHIRDLMGKQQMKLHRKHWYGNS